VLEVYRVPKIVSILPKWHGLQAKPNFRHPHGTRGRVQRATTTPVRLSAARQLCGGRRTTA
jgi:hypothetical protein